MTNWSNIETVTKIVQALLILLLIALNFVKFAKDLLKFIYIGNVSIIMLAALVIELIQTILLPMLLLQLLVVLSMFYWKIIIILIYSPIP